MAWTICIPTLSRYDLVARLCLCLNRVERLDIKLRIIVLDNGGALCDSSYWQYALKHCSLVSPELIVPSFNLGVAGSWNYFIRRFGACIIVNDDVLFDGDAIECFGWASMAFPDTVIFEGKDRVAGFSTFFVNQPDRWLAMGGFDELLNPAYFEDNDCRYRLKLAGQPVRKVLLKGWHHDNSSTLSASSVSYQRMHWCFYARNKAYYFRKWGGLPGAEKYLVPFAFT